MTVNCGHMNLENERCTLEANHDGEHTHFEYDDRGPFIRFKKKETLSGDRMSESAKEISLKEFWRRNKRR